MPEPLKGIEKLRIALTRLAGADGFTSLLRRALVLAGAEIPALQGVKPSADGRLQGFEPFHDDPGSGTAGDEAATAIAAHLLGLLVIFIGEPLTLRMVRDAWPETPLDERQLDPR